MSYVQRVVTATQSCLRRTKSIKLRPARVGRSTRILVLLSDAGKELRIQFYLQDRYRTFTL